MNDLERELESELHRVLDPISRLPIPARHPAANARVRGLVGGAGAALAFKLATGVAVAAAAVTVAGAATTGTVDPGTWGQQVSQHVQDCRNSLHALGTHGIGQCVSQFASTHGQQVSNQARQHGQGSGGNGAAQGGGGSAGQGNGKAGGNGHGKGNTNPPGNPVRSPGGTIKPGPPPGA